VVGKGLGYVRLSLLTPTVGGDNGVPIFVGLNGLIFSLSISTEIFGSTDFTRPKMVMPPNRIFKVGESGTDFKKHHTTRTLKHILPNTILLLAGLNAARLEIWPITFKTSFPTGRGVAALPTILSADMLGLHILDKLPDGLTARMKCKSLLGRSCFQSLVSDFVS
jgi:hypothetical protein